jgi:hypothetical protein
MSRLSLLGAGQCGVGCVLLPDSDSSNKGNQFNGSSYLSVANNSTIQTGDIDYSIAGWVTLDFKSSNRTIISKTASGGIGEYLLRYDSTADRFYWYMANGATYNDLSATSFGSPSTATKYFIYIYHDAAANSMGISVNNGTVDTRATTISPTTNTEPLVFGTFYNSGAPSNYLIGILDSWGFWKKKLTADEVTSLYNSGNGRRHCQLSGSLLTNLNFWYDLPENTGTRFDSTSNDNDLTDTGGCSQAAGVTTGDCVCQ